MLDMIRAARVAQAEGARVDGVEVLRPSGEDALVVGQQVRDPRHHEVGAVLGLVQRDGYRQSGDLRGEPVALLIREGDTPVCGAPQAACRAPLQVDVELVVSHGRTALRIPRRRPARDQIRRRSGRRPPRHPARDRRGHSRDPPRTSPPIAGRRRSPPQDRAGSCPGRCACRARSRTRHSDAHDRAHPTVGQPGPAPVDSATRPRNTDGLW